MLQFMYSFITFNGYIRIVRFQSLCFLSCYAAVFLYFTHYANEKFVPHSAPRWHDYYITNEDCNIKSDENVYKSTNNDF